MSLRTQPLKVKGPLPRVTPDAVTVQEIPDWACPDAQYDLRVTSLMHAAGAWTDKLLGTSIDRTFVGRFLHSAVGERRAISPHQLRAIPAILAQVLDETTQRGKAWSSVLQMRGGLSPRGSNPRVKGQVRPAKWVDDALRQLIDTWVEEDGESAPPEDRRRAIPPRVMAARAKQARQRLGRLLERLEELEEDLDRAHKLVEKYKAKGF